MTDQMNDEKKAALRKKIEYQVACEEKAFRIVERLIENPVEHDWFIDSLQFITPNHYQDVVEERAVAKLCGYPICPNNLGKVPTQKYFISTRSNKVYDIEGRKNFCNGRCYKASAHIERQISTAPIWSRKTEPRKKVDLLPLDMKLGKLGDEVQISTMDDMRTELQQLQKLDHYQKSWEAMGHSNRQDIEKATNRREMDSDQSNRQDSEIANRREMDLEQSNRNDCESGTKRELDSRKGVDQEGTGVDQEDIGADQEGTGAGYPENKHIHHQPHLGAGDECVYSLDKAMSELGIDENDEDLERDEREMKQRPKASEDKSKVVMSENREVKTSGKSCVDIQGTVEERKHSDKKGKEHKVKHKSDETSQQAKTEYLMKLLDKKKSLLAKMADIQPASTETVSGDSQPVGKPGDTKVKEAEQLVPVNRTTDLNVDSVHECSKGNYSVKPKETKVNENVVEEIGAVDVPEGKSSAIVERTLEPIEVPTEKGDAKKILGSPIEKGNEKKMVESQTEKGDAKITMDLPTEKGNTQKTIDSPTEKDGAKKTLESPTEKDGAKKTLESPTEKGDAMKTVNVTVLHVICESLKSWITQETVNFLKSKEKEKPVTGGKQKSKFDKQYRALVAKVDAQEKEFSDFLGEESLDQDADDTPTAPAPHFEVLKQEMAENELRVREFMKGSFTYRPDKPVVPKETKQKEIVLPSVDKYDQMLIRQRIVLDRLHKVLPDLLSPLHLPVGDVFSDIRQLTDTFNLTSDNILFRPAEWTLVALILLKMVSRKHEKLSSAFSTPSAEKYLTVLLTGIKTNTETLDHQVETLTGTLR